MATVTSLQGQSNSEDDCDGHSKSSIPSSVIERDAFNQTLMR